MSRLVHLLGLSCLFVAICGSPHLLSDSLADSPPKSDQQLLEEIEQHVQRQGRGSGANVEIQVTGGIAELSGEVTSYADRMLLERICRRVNGIAAVENRLQVVPTLVTDEALIRSVKERMAADALLHPESVEITAQKGIISLRGTVPTWTDRRRATAAARQVQGVVDVLNDIAVAQSNDGQRATVPDAIIASQLNKLLAGASPLAQLEINFHLNRGQVVLEGWLSSLQQKNFVRDLIQAIPGVVHVDIRKIRVSDEPGASVIDLVDENSAAGKKAVVQLVMDAASVEPTRKVSVQLQDEELVLEGEVESLAQQQRLINLAKAFSGAWGIRNRLSVTPAARPDAAIEQELQAVLENDAILSEANLGIDVQGGKATLTGHVPDFNTKARAVRIATRIAGLNAIDNRVTVTWRPNVSDDGLKKTIEKRIEEKYSRQVTSLEIKVVEGIATLRGTVSDPELERLIVELIERVDCIRSLRSELTVTPLPAEIARH